MRSDPYPPYNQLDSVVVAQAELWLEGVGVRCDGPHTDMTPYRITHYLKYLTAPAEPLQFTSFPNVDPCVDHMVVVPRIPFWSACSHHCLPFVGEVSVGYIPKDWVVGLSKIPLLVRQIARGFWLQEHLANRIADVLDERLHPQGIAVYIDAMHTCQLLDLKNPPIPRMITAVLRGILMHGSAAREEFYALARGGP